MGFALFLRVRGKLQPTPEALLLEREVNKVTESLQGVQRLAESLRRAPGHRLRIGSTPALALSLMPPVISEWTQRYPDISCELASAQRVDAGEFQRRNLAGPNHHRPDQPHAIEKPHRKNRYRRMLIDHLSHPVDDSLLLAER